MDLQRTYFLFIVLIEKSLPETLTMLEKACNAAIKISHFFLCGHNFFLKVVLVSVMIHVVKDRLSTPTCEAVTRNAQSDGPGRLVKFHLIFSCSLS